MLRVGLGVVLGAHGLQKLFGWWGGQGLGAFKNSLSDAGYQHADILSYVSAGGEIAAGVLLVLGGPWRIPGLTRDQDRLPGPARRRDTEPSEAMR